MANNTAGKQRRTEAGEGRGGKRYKVGRKDKEQGRQGKKIIGRVSRDGKGEN